MASEKIVSYAYIVGKSNYKMSSNSNLLISKLTKNKEKTQQTNKQTNNNNNNNICGKLSQAVGERERERAAVSCSLANIPFLGPIQLF